MDVLIWIACILGGYALGGILFSQHIPKRLCKTDIRSLSNDNNPRSFNVFSICGWKVGLLCLFLDMLKGFLPVAICMLLADVHHPAFCAMMAAPVLGHATAPFNKGNGGKCIATAFGIMIALLPITRIGIILAVLYILFSTILKIGSAPIRSIITFVLFGIISLFQTMNIGLPIVGIGTAIISTIVIAKHIIPCYTAKRIIKN